jgi:hypothetical protein
MNNDNSFEYINSKLDERRVELEQHLGRNAAKTYDEYQKLCGFIQGLEFAKQLISDLAKRMETEDDE